MMDEKQLLDLIKVMSIEETYSSSDESPSFQAHRIAEKITEVTHIPFLYSLLEKSKDKEIRSSIYFILRKIGENTGDKRVFDILFQRLQVETDNYLLMTILEGIDEQEHVVEDCIPILSFIEHKSPLVRQSAIRLLGKCKDSEVEDILIKVLTKSKDSYDLYYAISTLCNIESMKSIPYILPLVKHKDIEVRCAAITAIDKLGDSTYLPLFIEAMKDRSFDVKYHALEAIRNHGDETAIDVVYKRVKTVLSKKRTVVSDELIVAFEFLNRYKKEYAKIQELFEWIKIKKIDSLYDEERDWFLKNI